MVSNFFDAAFLFIRSNSPYTYLIIPVLICTLFLFRIVKAIAIACANRKIRKSFLKRYGFPALSSEYAVSMRDRSTDPSPNSNYYHLSFPKWHMSTNDGSRDRRYKNNFLHWSLCDLYINSFHVSCYDAILMVRLVNALRNKGYKINPNKLEEQKYQLLSEHYIARQRMDSIQAIIHAFESCPSDFEYFCANLFDAMGYTTHVTARTNDGGFDIVMQKDQLSYIVECKCYSPLNSIGRPLLQKLVGANAIQQANVMVFVTTSSFSSSAIEYADHFGIWLIDGAQLFTLYQMYIPNTPSLTHFSASDWSLTEEDVLSYYPPDYCQ